MTKTIAGSSRAKKFARSLLKENRRGRSWRVIAREDYQDRVNHATLNRIAIHKGEWLPKDEEILKTIGLIKERSPYSGLPKWFVRTEGALRFFNGQRDRVKQMSKSTRDEVTKTRRNP